MRFLELKIPPPVLGLLVVAAQFGLWSLRVCPLPNPYPVSSAILFGVIGMMFTLLSMARFRKAGTTIVPTHPEKTTQLVATGIYRFSRNPMYIGATLFLLAVGTFLDDGLALLLVPLFAVYINFFQIIPEERVLERLFGDEYLAYKKRVRRWI